MVDYSSFSKPVKSKIISLGVILSSLLIGELMNDKPDALKKEILAIHCWWTVAALMILSYCLVLSFDNYLGINLTFTL